MLTSKQRAILRKQANTLLPVFQIGKGEIDQSVITATSDCIAARELIKMKVLENSSYSAKQASEILCKEINCDGVQVIGNTFVLYKQKNKESRFADMLK